MKSYIKQNNGAVYRVLCFILIVFFASSCAKKYKPFVTQAPPYTPMIVESIPLSYVGPPPIIVSDNIILTQSITSQHFKIGVPDCIDKTGGLVELYIIPIAEKLNTALSQTKRFELLDKGEIRAIEKLSLKKDVFNYQLSTDSVKIQQDSNLVNLKYKELRESEEKYKQLILDLTDRCDGVLMVNISSVFNASSNENIYNKIMVAECKIMSTSGDNMFAILWAQSFNIRFFAQKSTESLKICEEDIQKIANDIKQYFPNPDLQNGLKITSIRDQIITVNAGKKNNISKGMLGYVVKLNDDGKSYQFRALFEVTEVFPEAFNAKFKIRKDQEELNTLIIKQIVVGDPIRMK
jgi:hypothetical protein